MTLESKLKEAVLEEISEINPDTIGFVMPKYIFLAKALNLLINERMVSVSELNGALEKSIAGFAKKYCELHPKKYLMIEYALMKGINDSDKDIEKLTKIKWPKRTLFNFIQFNDFGKFKQTDIERIREFKQKMRDAGYKAFIRQSRGNDIKAACGMLDYS